MLLFWKRPTAFVGTKIYSKRGPIGLKYNENGSIEVIFKKTYTEKRYVTGLWYDK